MSNGHPGKSLTVLQQFLYRRGQKKTTTYDCGYTGHIPHLDVCNKVVLSDDKS